MRIPTESEVIYLGFTWTNNQDRFTMYPNYPVWWNLYTINSHSVASPEYTDYISAEG